MTVEDKVLSKTLQIKNGKLLRNVDDTLSIKKILEILEKKGYKNNFVVKTQIFSEDEKLIEHEILKYIIHSGEYTESMAYDVNIHSLKMALDLIDEGVYAYDLLPHNFTFYNGKWFLYDFDSFQLNPEKIITEIRGFFKIVFSNFEILRLISRKELGYFYLTRYRIEDIIKLIPFTRWLYLFFNQSICNILYKLKAYKLCFIFIKKLFEKYSKKHIKNYLEYEEKNNYSYLNSLINEYNIATVFCVGETSANWAISNEYTHSNIQKLVYIDDYEICDNYYNFIVKNDLKNIIPAVLYPLINDNEISKDYKYRALYDSYAQERFYSDCTIALDFSDNDKENLLKNLSIFTSNVLILSAEQFSEKEVEYLKSIFKEVNIKEEYIVASGKKIETIPHANKPYKDGNRGPDAHRQTWEVLKLLQNK